MLADILQFLSSILSVGLFFGGLLAKVPLKKGAPFPLPKGREQRSNAAQTEENRLAASKKKHPRAPKFQNKNRLPVRHLSGFLDSAIAVERRTTNHSVSLALQKAPAQLPGSNHAYSPLRIFNWRRSFSSSG